MAHKYSDEEKEFIENNCKGKTVDEILEAFNKQFDMNLSRTQLRSFMKNHGLKSGIDRHKLAKTYHKSMFTDEQIKFIKENAKGIENKELAQKFNLWFKTDFSAGQIERIKARKHISSGLTGHFPKGNVPSNKGIKGVHAKGCEKSWFKKGHVSQNHKPVGSERIDVDGYAYVKVSEPNEWRLKHQVVWEQHKGKIPNGYAVIFGDRDRTNFDIDNLILVSRQQLLILNKNKLIQNDANLTRTGVIIADIYQKISEAKNENSQNR